MGAILQLEHIEKSFAERTILRDIHIRLDEGEIVSLLAPAAAAKVRCCASLPGWTPIIAGVACMAKSRAPARITASAWCFRKRVCFRG
jgi:ABC-type (unclassified) transport system, ATPase component